MSRRTVPYAPSDVIGGKYRVLRLIGAGGMAAVFEAEDTTIGRRVAIKVIHPDIASRGQFTQRQMEDEGRMLVGIAQSTDHVVEVLTAGVTDDRYRLPYYVMELLRGYTLRYAIERKRAEKKPLTVFDATGIALDLACALMHAHEQGIVHRDVKPENAFVHKQRDGSVIVKLLDFGIGAWVGRSAADSGFKGTYRYAAPEQHRREAVTPATDVYAAGLVLFELLALRTPFEELDRPLRSDLLVRAHLETEAPLVSRFRAGVPSDLEALVASCLRKNPAERPQTAHLLARRLEVLRDRFDPTKKRSHVEAISDVGLDPLPFPGDPTEPDGPPLMLRSGAESVYEAPRAEAPRAEAPRAVAVVSVPRERLRVDSNAPVVTTSPARHDPVARQSKRDSALVAGLGVFTALLLALTGWLILQPIGEDARRVVASPPPSTADAGAAARDASVKDPTRP